MLVLSAGSRVRIVSSPRSETQIAIGHIAVVLFDVTDSDSLFKVEIPDIMVPTFVLDASGILGRGEAPMQMWCSRSMIKRQRVQGLGFHSEPAAYCCGIEDYE